jgi:cell wall-associated NlpC family hydrolase
VLAVACTFAISGTPAYADHNGPSAQDVARAQAAAQAKAAQAGAAKAQLAIADAQLAQLQQQTDAAIANYQSAVARLATAQHAAARATLALQDANQKLYTQRQQMGSFVASAYRSGGRLGMLSALLNSDGPQTFLDSANAINSISSSQDAVMQRMHAAQIVQTLAQQEANAALSAVQKAVGARKSALDAATHAVDNQQRQVAAIAAAKSVLETQAASAQTHADSLRRERERNLEAARQAQAAAEQRRKLGSGGVDEENPTAVSGGPRPPATAAQGETAVEFAKNQLGKPYEWGADGPSTYDCSGLTMMAWNSAGISIDHYSVAQYGEGDHVSRLDLRPGDLVFFAYDTSDASTIHHVGIYVGNGEMIDAPHTGANVRYDPAFRSDYIGATRP